MSADPPPEPMVQAPLSDAVATAAENHPGRGAVCTPLGTTTWGEVDRAASALVAPLQALGVRRSDPVAIAMHSGPRWLVAATAVNRLGATIAGISPVLPAAQRSSLVSVVDPRLVLADPDLIDGLPLRTPVAAFSTDGLGLADPLPGSGADHPGTGVRPLDSHPGGTVDDGAPYAVCFTSGTTGQPKAALFSAAAAAAVQRIDLGDDPPVGAGGHMISSTQFAHVGFVLKVPGHALLGMTIHVMDRWTAAEAISLVAENRISTLGVVAPQLALMLRSPELGDADLSALRTVVAGGAPSPEALVTEARERLGVTYSIRWSSTESGGVGLAADVDDANPEAIGTIGHPRPGVRARVVTGQGTAAALGEIGELQIDSAAVMSHYVGDPEATADAFTSDGWLRTGDLAKVRADGRYVLAGRRSDMFIRGGYNVHPQEVEAVLGTHEGVSEIAVVPRDDAVMGQVGVAVVVPVEGCEPPALEQLRSHAQDHLARHQLPEDISIRSSLPMTDGGKLDRKRLASEVAATTGTSS